MDLTRLLLANKPIKTIKQAFASNKASHAYIIEGEASMVEKSLTLLSCFALCDNFGCLSCVNCLNALKGLHVDCSSYPNEKDRINVANIEELVDLSVVKPKISKNRVFLVNACKMSFADNWQGKILKTLEEPNSNVYIFIGVTNLGELNDTVKSRCYCVTLEKTPPKQIADYFVANGFELKPSQIASVLCVGNLYRAEQILLSNDSQMCDIVFDMFINMTSSGYAIKYVSKLAKYEQKCKELFLLMQTILLNSVKLNGELELSSYIDELKLVANNYSKESVYRIIEYIDTAKRNIDRGVSYDATLDNLILKILEVKHKCQI
ncbi:MAG: hypothetical protein RR248_00185 [Clostridia bacterium]